VLTIALGCWQSRAAAQPEPRLSELQYHALMGTWSCAGFDDRGAAVSATMAWGFNDGGGFYLTIDPKPSTPLHSRISETWEWDAAGGVWRAIPDAGTAEQAQFTTAGWSGHTLTWIRMAAQSTTDRAFVRTEPDRLTFRSERTILPAATGPPRKHVLYHVACKRTVNDAPR
jgi:hypothetical protein